MKRLSLALALLLVGCQSTQVRTLPQNMFSSRMVPQRMMAPQYVQGMNPQFQNRSFNGAPGALRMFNLPESQGIRLTLTSGIIQELNQPEHEPEPPSEEYDEELVRELFQEHLSGHEGHEGHAGHDSDFNGQYVHAHSMYFSFLDQGRSSVEQIFLNDGHARAAQYVQKWRDLLAESAIWPDHNSTTWSGPWKPLEHGLPSANRGWFGLRNAKQKAQEYYNRALGAWKPGLAPDHPDQAEAWAWIGRTSHFIQDLTVPFHNRSLVRPAQIMYHNKYEVSSEKNFGKYVPSRNHNAHGVWQNGPYPQGQQWGYYFPQEMGAGDMILQLGNESSPFYKIVGKRDKNDNWEKTRTVMVPMGAKATAGLIYNFLQNVGAE